jgi:hypothetical protein
MQGPASVVEALAVLAAIVTVHECGHFLAARLQNIHVTKFSIGFGPALLSYQVGLVCKSTATYLLDPHSFGHISWVTNLLFSDSLRNLVIPLLIVTQPLSVVF